MMHWKNKLLNTKCNNQWKSTFSQLFAQYMLNNLHEEDSQFIEDYNNINNNNNNNNDNNNDNNNVDVDNFLSWWNENNIIKKLNNICIIYK